MNEGSGVLIFVKSEMSANRVMKSISGWLERKLFLKVNATKTKVVRPTRSKYLGFTFLNHNGTWKVKPTTEKKKKLSEYLKRGKAIARPLAVTIKRVRMTVRSMQRKGFWKGCTKTIRDCLSACRAMHFMQQRP